MYVSKIFFSLDDADIIIATSGTVPTSRYRRGDKKIYFSNRKGFGNIAPAEDMTALRDKLTAESVVWVCIAVTTFCST